MDDDGESHLPVGPAHWKAVAAVVHEAIIQLDCEFGWANVPLSARKGKAFDIVRESFLVTSDHIVFYRSEAHGRILVIVEEWYRDWLGDAVEDDDVQFLIWALLVHGAQFLMHDTRSSGRCLQTVSGVVVPSG